jgi:Concanavalin A-like lectin/glucanases superfamily
MLGGESLIAVRPIRSLLLALALPLSLVSAAQAAPPGGTSSGTLPAYGLNALEAEGLADTPLGIDDLGRMGKGNVGLYRARFNQAQVLSGGNYSNWTKLDNLAKQAALKGVTLTPVLINMPIEGTYTAPTTDAGRTEFGRFAEAAARRYGPNGSFWSSCGCKSRPVRVWEVWNEQNITAFWNQPDAAQYAELLKVVRGKLRGVDSGARIMIGGLAYGGTGIGPDSFLKTVIETAGPNSFDALALHSYHWIASNGVSAVGGTVDTLKQYAGTGASGAPRQQVWVNEFGHRTSLDRSDEQAQADWLNAFLDGVLPHRSDWNVGPVLWYALRDAKDAADRPTEAWLRLGLRRTNTNYTDAGPKPAWNAYVARSSSASGVSLPKDAVTVASKPVVSTGGATAITDTSATLNGSVNPVNRQTSYRFEYGTSTAYGSRTTDQTVSPTDDASHSVAANVGNLIPGASYHYRLVATNATGTTAGADQSFTATASYRGSVLATSGLAGYWRLGEQSGTTATDEKGANPGTYLGGYTLGQPGTLATDPNDTSAAFDGTSGEMTTGGPALTSSGALEGWFNWQNGVALMRDGSSAGGTGWILAFDNNGNLYYRLGGTSFNTGRTTASVKDGWHHFVATKDGGSVAFYLDGQLVHSGSGAGGIAPTMPWHVMRNGGYAQFSQGGADEVAVYGVALSAATVQQHYNAGKGP